jgi:hypothetical protein
MSLTVYPANVYADSTGAMVVLTATPNRAVSWSIASGDGTLTPITEFTDEQGVAAAMYVPGTSGTTVVIEADYGA